MPEASAPRRRCRACEGPPGRSATAGSGAWRSSGMSCAAPCARRLPHNKVQLLMSPPARMHAGACMPREQHAEQEYPIIYSRQPAARGHRALSQVSAVPAPLRPPSLRLLEPSSVARLSPSLSVAPAEAASSDLREAARPKLPLADSASARLRRAVAFSRCCGPPCTCAKTPGNAEHA